MVPNVGRPFRFISLVGALLFVFGGWAFAAGSTSHGVWIDAPLDGSTVAPGVVTIIGHVTDPDGLHATRLEVDGIKVAELAVDVVPGELVTVTHTWEATTPGSHIVALWGGRHDGSWSGPAAVSVLVTGEVDSSATTSTTSSTSTSTTEPCSITTPFGLSPSGNATYTSSAATLTWAYNGCTPVEFEVEIWVGTTYVASAVVAGTSWNVTLPQCGGEYIWWVSAVPSVGSPSDLAVAAFTYIPFGGC